jgi:uncharacterized Zn finger protein
MSDRRHPVDAAASEWIDTVLAALAAQSSLGSAALDGALRTARSGGVDNLTVEPGAVAAMVRAGRGGAFVSLGLRRWSTDESVAVLAALAAAPRSVAELLAGDLPSAIAPGADDAPAWFPAERELSFTCSCGGWDEPCRHALAVAVAVADLARRQPLLLMTVRGLDPASVVSELRRSSLDAPVTESADSGAGASAILGRPDDPTAPVRRTRGDGDPTAGLDTFHQLLPRVASGRVIAPATEPPAGLGVSAEGIERLARDAAARAAAMLQSGAPSGLDLDDELDLVRRCVDGQLAAVELAERLKLSADEAATVLSAFAQGGVAVADVVLRPRRLDEAELAAVEAASGQAVRSRSTGALLASGDQIRRASTGVWVRLRFDEASGWVVCGAERELHDLL